MQHTELNSAAQTVQKSTQLRRNRIAFTSLIIMVIMSWFCAMTPWVSDDFAFSNIYPGCAGLWDMQVLEYKEWSGKFIGHFMARVLLRGSVWLHPLLTPIMFLLLVAGGSLLVTGARWRERLSAWHLAVLAGLVWIALPAFGTVFFWRTGTGDYGYSLVWSVLFLVPYRIWADKADFRMPGGLLYVLAGIFAGWSNENVGMLALLTALCVTLFRWRRSGNVPAWALSGIAGAAFGWSMMMAAPGNAVRLAAVGGAEKIPLLSMPSFLRFLEFWSTQQLEMLPYFLAALAFAWLLRRRGLLKPTAWIPPVVFFLMAQASLVAFVVSPSTPYRAMSATFFFAALCPFSLLTTLNPSSIRAKALLTIFCALLLSSVLLEARIFLMARPVIAARSNTLRSLDYPKTDKYFFPGYDIREINLFSTGWRDLVPWNESQTLRIFEAPAARALVACNIAFFDNLPQGKVHVAARVRTATTASLLQQAARALFESPDENLISARTAALRYFPASATVTDDGKAAVFIPGIKSVDDIAYIAIEQPDAPLVWRRASVSQSQN